MTKSHEHCIIGYIAARCIEAHKTISFTKASPVDETLLFVHPPISFCSRLAYAIGSMKPTATKVAPARRRAPTKRPRVAEYHGVALPDDAAERRRMRNKLSARVHRQRKQDALATAEKEVAGCDARIGGLQARLEEVSLTTWTVALRLCRREHLSLMFLLFQQTRLRAASLRSIMDAIRREYGDEAIHHILQRCQRPGSHTALDFQMPRSVTSDSDNYAASSSSPSSDEDSLG